MQTTNNVWLDLLREIFLRGLGVSPRGQGTLELLHHTIKISMADPVITIPARKLNYKFMLANAYWILSGDNRVETLAPYNRNIAQFSDDGVTFFGAYGPPIEEQMDYVVGKLIQDPDTRQAVMTIWRPNPPMTKDVPCTVAMAFNIRRGRLNLHVFMRSSDAWLGVPYDVFDFSMVASQVLWELHRRGIGDVVLGDLYLTAASSHVYERNMEGADEVLLWAPSQPDAPPLWDPLQIGGGVSPRAFLAILKDTPKDDPRRWWNVT